MAVSSLTVDRLSQTNLTINWTAPFTLDINDVNPDISGYCVDVVNLTSSATLFSGCGITDTEFDYPEPPDSDCHAYSFTVSAMNVVGRGEANTVVYRGRETRRFCVNHS